MKKLCVLGMILMTTGAMAQYGTNGESGKYKVVGFPKYYVEQDQRTFGVEVEMTSKKVSGYVEAEEMADKISFSGWSKTTDDKANLKINIKLNDFIYVATEILDESVDEKQKDGSVKRTPIFRGSFKYTFPIHISMTSPAGNAERYLNMVGSMASDLRYTDENKFSSRAAASEYMKENRDVFVEKVIREEAFEAAAAAKKLAISNYGFGTDTDKASYVFLDSKKNPHYESQKNADVQLKELFKTSTPSEPIDSDVLKPIIEEYISIINELNDADKKQAKAKVQMMVSVAEFYLMLDDFDASATWAQRVVDEYNEKDGAKILERIKTIKELLEKHHVTARHFVPQAPVIPE